jgi:hypothetical protein
MPRENGRVKYRGKKMLSLRKFQIRQIRDNHTSLSVAVCYWPLQVIGLEGASTATGSTLFVNRY